MTDLRKAAEMALEALRNAEIVKMEQLEAMYALQEALAQPEQEPVKYKCTIIDDEHPNGIPLEQWGNTAPPKREWVGLTDEDLKPLCDEGRIMYGGYVDDFAKAIEAKLKEKNT